MKKVVSVSIAEVCVGAASYVESSRWLEDRMVRIYRDDILYSSMYKIRKKKKRGLGSVVVLL